MAYGTFWREAYCSARTRLMAASSLLLAMAPISSLDRVLPSHPLLLFCCCCCCSCTRTRDEIEEDIFVSVLCRRFASIISPGTGCSFAEQTKSNCKIIFVAVHCSSASVIH